MNPRTAWGVAVDVLREALASRYLIVLFGLIVLGLLVLILALDLEVVDGAIAAGKLFGGTIVSKGQAGKVGVAEFLKPVLVGISYLTFFVGLLFLVVAVADIAPKMLAPGRVELLLSLPIRRTELVLGIYVGVVLIAVLASALAVGGASLVLFIKAEFFTLAPLMGAVTGLTAFLALYGVMLAVATVARSASLSAGAAILVYIAGVATSDRQLILSFIRSPFMREAAAVAMGPLPRLKALADVGAQVTGHEAVAWAQAVPVVGGTVAFALVALIGACIVVNIKDY